MDDTFDYEIDYIDLGSGLFGDLGEELRDQFSNSSSYEDYAAIVAGCMARHYENKKHSLLFTEPDTTVVSKYFYLFSTILDIKAIRGKAFALLNSSFYNVDEICGLKKVPVVIHENAVGNNQIAYESLDLVRYTCLEQDVVYRILRGKLQ